ncbi:MAG: hypothetical protein PHQ59_05725 [Candidatus Daviesbacteria bacterium]|nr:hypothetical protein [Candidatus Daviesbacteria bacterium]
MKKLSTSLFFCFLLVLLGVSFLYGVLVPRDNQAKSVGSMQIAAYKNGLALYQQNKPYFYTISPFNDYFFSKEGIRSSLITKQDIDQNNFKSSFKLSHLEAVKDNLKGFFGLVQPNIMYETKDFQVRYDSKFINNSVSINRHITLKNGGILPILGTTLTFSGADFIYDKSGNLYSYQTEQDIASFEKFYGIHLQYKSGDPRVLIEDKTIFIMNPFLASVLEVKADATQSLYIDLSNQMVEIQDTASWQGSENNSSITVSVYDNPKEVL